MPAQHPGPRILIVDNYDSYTFNLYQYFTAATGQEPIVIRNDQYSWKHFQTNILNYFDGIVISPGPGRPDKAKDFGICLNILKDCNLPILGVCLGHQGLASVMGGKVVHADPPMHGRTSPIIHDGKNLFKNIPSPFNAVRYHSLVVSTEDLPASLSMTAWCAGAGSNQPIIMGLQHNNRPIWTVQFHPESICTDFGQTIINNFTNLVEEHWSLIAFRPSSKAMPECLTGISVIPSPLVSPTSQITSNFEILINPVNFIVDSESVFTNLYSKEKQTDTFWLDSAKVEKGLSRYSFMGDISGPEGYRISYNLEKKRITKYADGKSVDSFLDEESFFENLSRIMRHSYVDPKSIDADYKLPPFLGGLVGYIGYEMKAETLKCSPGQENFKINSAVNVPDSSFLFTDRVIVFDHEECKIFVVALFDSARQISTRKIQQGWIKDTTKLLETLAVLSGTSSKASADVPVKKISEIKLSHDREEYVGMIKESLSKIREGETYEVCLTTQLKANISHPHPHPLEMYKHLRNRNPAPYAAYLSFGENMVVTSSSPERFLRIVEDGLITMKPIKGTLKRASPMNFKGSLEEIELENERRMTELATGEKNRSENLMIVDLIRNDLNQISLPNSVHVPALMVVESYATVHQLVSTVSSTIRPELTAVDAAMRSFPPGSMTGAPKLRTVEIIESLEKIPRGPYSGVLGFFSVCGQADLSVVIRTAVFDKQSTHTEISVGAGGAIVILSDPTDEFDEMVLKAHSVLPTNVRLRIVTVTWIIIGFMIPVWYHFVKVYRSPLPYAEIDSLLNHKLNMELSVKVKHNDLNVEIIKDGLNQVFQSTDHMDLKVNVGVREEQETPLPGNYLINVECNKNNGAKIYTNRIASLALKDCSGSKVEEGVVTLLSAIFAPEFKMLKEKYLPMKEKNSEKRAVKYSSEYNVVFSMLVGNPEDAIITWEAEKLLQNFRPLVEQFANHTTFKLSSQVQNYATLPLVPTPAEKDGKTVYKLYPKDLTHFINSAEWNLASAVSNSPAIHFILYIPPQKLSPLLVVRSDGSLLPSNAFLIPQWGGIVIENFAKTDDRIHLSTADLHHIIEIFTQQFLTLLGVVPMNIDRNLLASAMGADKFEVVIESDKIHGLSGWELDRLLRRSAVQNIADTVSTMKSLSSMLQSLTTIAVLDNITVLVNQAIKSLKMASKALSQNECNLAAQEARSAIFNAEKAFFDPKMVSMLYFPAEHLLAIYMPFFVPIAVPMITALYKEFKIWRSRPKIKKD